jgi:hypothetical protein
MDERFFRDAWRKFEVGGFSPWKEDSVFIYIFAIQRTIAMPHLAETGLALFL